MDEVFRYKQKIRKLLEERPELKPFQEEIERKLKNAGNSHNRMVLIKSMMMDSLARLSDALRGIRDSK